MATNNTSVAVPEAKPVSVHAASGEDFARVLVPDTAADKRDLAKLVSAGTLTESQRDGIVAGAHILHRASERSGLGVAVAAEILLRTKAFPDQKSVAQALGVTPGYVSQRLLAARASLVFGVSPENVAELTAAVTTTKGAQIRELMAKVGDHTPNATQAKRFETLVSQGAKEKAKGRKASPGGRAPAAEGDAGASLRSSSEGQNGRTGSNGDRPSLIQCIAALETLAEYVGTVEMTAQQTATVRTACQGILSTLGSK